MKPIIRYDIGRLDKAELTSQGFLRIPAFVGRTGVQTYYDAEGKEILEDRPKDEVFSQKTLTSLKGAPVTDDHPAVMVNQDNVHELMKGFGSDTIEVIDEKFQKSHLTITDKNLVKKIMDGKDEVSLGYEVDLEFKSGINKDGERFDAIQRNIRINHIAIVDKGRAGPEVRVRLDSVGNQILTVKEDTTMKIKIGDKEFEVSDEVAKAFKGFSGDQSKKISDLEKAVKDAGKKKDNSEELTKKNSEIETLNAKVDSLEHDLKKSNAGKTEKKDHEDFMAKVKERKNLEAVAERVLDEESVKTLDSMDDISIKKAVIEKECEGTKLDGKTEDYVNARFDHIAESVMKSKKANEKIGDKTYNKDANDNARTDNSLGAKQKAYQDKVSQGHTQPVGRQKSGVTANK